MKEKLILTSLNEEQIKCAKNINGARKKITHALLCGVSGQIFGTEKYCKKYYSAWSKIFPNVFDHALETDSYEITDYSSTFDLVNILIAKNDKIEKQESPKFITPNTRKPVKKSFFARIFGG